MKRPIGKFRIADAYLPDRWKELLPLFSQMVIVRCELHYSDFSFHYVAISDLFEPIDEAVAPPEYDMICDNRDGAPLWSAERKVAA